MKLGLAKSSSGGVCRAEGLPVGLERVGMLEVPLCAWATVGLQRSQGVVGPAPLPALRRGLLVLNSVWAVEPSRFGEDSPRHWSPSLPGPPLSIRPSSRQEHPPTLRGFLTQSVKKQPLPPFLPAQGDPPHLGTCRRTQWPRPFAGNHRWLWLFTSTGQIKLEL